MRIYREDIKRTKEITASQANKCFWNFYALYTLWANTGALDEHENDTEFFKGPYDPKSHRRLKVINNVFEKFLYKYVPVIIDACKWSCKVEARHFYNGTGLNTDLLNPAKLLRTYWIDNNKVLHKNLDWNDLITLYYAQIRQNSGLSEIPIYAPAWCPDFGGDKWAEVAECGMSLEKALYDGDITKVIYLVDHLFDLQHNGGQCLNKTEFNILESRLHTHKADTSYGERFKSELSMLDCRAMISNIREYIELKSIKSFLYPHVLRLINSNLHLIVDQPDIPGLTDNIISENISNNSSRLIINLAENYIKPLFEKRQYFRIKRILGSWNPTKYHWYFVFNILNYENRRWLLRRLRSFERGRNEYEGYYKGITWHDIWLQDKNKSNLHQVQQAMMNASLKIKDSLHKTASQSKKAVKCTCGCGILFKGVKTKKVSKISVVKGKSNVVFPICLDNC